MQRLKLTIAYVGSRFHGWQIQATPGKPHPRTVQQVLEKAAAHILGRAVHVHGAGRTDSGVHADAQCAHMDVPEEKANFNWRRALNSLLPDDVSVLAVEPAPPGFHAQHSAVKKLYTYRLWLPREYVLPAWRPFVWTCGPVDLAAMEAAACHMTGMHDFASFQNQGTDVQTTVRTVYGIRSCSEPGVPQELLVAWQFEADGFLKQMVRNLMGLLVAVGRGKISADRVAYVLESRNRAHAGVTAPAHGLTLTRVSY